MSIHVNVPDLSVNMPPEGMMMVTLFKSYPVKSWKVRHYELPFKRLGPISHHTGDRLEVGGDGHDIVWSVFVHRLQHSFPWPLLTLCWQNDLLTRYWHLWTLYLLRITLWISSLARPLDWGSLRDETLCCFAGTFSWATNWETVNWAIANIFTLEEESFCSSWSLPA